MFRHQSSQTFINEEALNFHCHFLDLEVLIMVEGLDLVFIILQMFIKLHN